MPMVALLLLLTAASCNTADAMASRAASTLPRIEITTDGGFSGRGLGSIAIDGETITVKDLSRTCHGELSTDQRHQIEHALASFAEVTRGDAHPDQIHYVLKAGDRTASWYGEAPPNEAAPLFQAVWPLRQKILANCQ